MEMIECALTPVERIDVIQKHHSNYIDLTEEEISNPTLEGVGLILDSQHAIMVELEKLEESIK